MYIFPVRYDIYLFALGLLSWLLLGVCFWCAIYYCLKEYNAQYISLVFYALVAYNTFTWPFGHWSRKIVLYVPNYILFDYITAPFLLLTAADTIRFGKAWGFWGHAFLLGAFILLKVYHSISRHFSRQWQDTQIHQSKADLK